MGEITMGQFMTTVKSRMQPEAAMDLPAGEQPEVVTLNNEESSLVVRLAGGYVISTVLSGMNGGRSIPLFHGDPHDPRYMIDASHDLTPVDEKRGLGGHSGFPRWVDRNVCDEKTAYQQLWAPEELLDKEVQRLVLKADTPANYFQFLNGYELGKYGTFVAISSLTNTSTFSRSTSMGSHFCLRLSSGPAPRLKIEDYEGESAPIDLDVLRMGKPQLWDDYPGAAIINLPRGEVGLATHVCLRDSAGELPSSVRPKLSFRYRQDTDTICVEPTWGFAGVAANGQPINQRLQIPGGVSAIMENVFDTID